jgi:hypothetical protein
MILMFVPVQVLVLIITVFVSILKSWKSKIQATPDRVHPENFLILSPAISSE